MEISNPQVDWRMREYDNEALDSSEDSTPNCCNYIHTFFAYLEDISDLIPKVVNQIYPTKGHPNMHMRTHIYFSR